MFWKISPESLRSIMREKLKYQLISAIERANTAKIETASVIFDQREVNQGHCHQWCFFLAGFF